MYSFESCSSFLEESATASSIQPSAPAGLVTPSSKGSQCVHQLSSSHHHLDMEINSLIYSALWVPLTVSKVHYLDAAIVH